MSGYQAINGDIVKAVFRSLLNGRLEQQPYQERSKTLELCKTCRMARFNLRTRRPINPSEAGEWIVATFLIKSNTVLINSASECNPTKKTRVPVVNYTTPGNQAQRALVAL